MTHADMTEPREASSFDMPSMVGWPKARITGEVTVEIEVTHQGRRLPS
ncbi:MAG: hypothetical protein O3A96_13490 [Proteobacteria bacterium]|nr:hypothetical protein [Pseudomonadota bacterium]